MNDALTIFKSSRYRSQHRYKL